MDRLSIPFQCIQAGMDNPIADLEIPVQKFCSSHNGLYPARSTTLPRKPSELLFENKRLSEHRKIFGKRFSIFPRHSKLSIATLIRNSLEPIAACYLVPNSIQPGGPSHARTIRFQRL
jgi:hypothetical protein